MEMRQKLPGHYHLALDTMVRPTIDHLQRITMHLASVYIDELGIEFPALNFNVLLFMYIQRLVLPPYQLISIKPPRSLPALQITISPIQHLQKVENKLYPFQKRS